MPHTCVRADSICESALTAIRIFGLTGGETHNVDSETARPHAHIHINTRLVCVVYLQPAAFVAVTSKVYPDLLFRPLTVIVPVFDDVSFVDPFAPSLAEKAVNDVHGDSLDDAMNFTSALRAMRMADALRL